MKRKYPVKAEDPGYWGIITKYFEIIGLEIDRDIERKREIERQKTEPEREKEERDEKGREKERDRQIEREREKKIPGYNSKIF